MERSRITEQDGYDDLVHTGETFAEPLASRKIDGPLAHLTF